MSRDKTAGRVTWCHAMRQDSPTSSPGLWSCHSMSFHFSEVRVALPSTDPVRLGMVRDVIFYPNGMAMTSAASNDHLSSIATRIPLKT